MPGGQGQMIQMIAALSEMQQRRRAQDLAEAQFKNSQSEFGKQFGLQEKSAEYKKVSDLLDAIARSSSESRSALTELGTSLGLDPASVQALAHYGQTAPETMQQLQMRAAGRGYAQATPQQQGQMNTEAAYQGTTGGSQGAAAMSGLQNIMALGGNPQAMQSQFGQKGVANMIQGFVQRAATNQTPFEAAGDLANMPQSGQAARYKYGLQMTPAQIAANAVANRQAGAAEGGVQADFYRTNASIIAQSQEIAAKLATAKAFGGLTPENLIQGVGGMREILTQIGKEKDKSARTLLLGNYNKLAEVVDPRLRWDGTGDPPEPAGMLSKMLPGGYNQMQGGYPSAGPPQQQNPNAQFPFAPAPSGQQFAPFGQTPYQNPMTPFINRGQP